MKLLASNGREYSIQPLDYICTNDEIQKSSGHLLVRQLLKEIYPCEWILEEVPARVDGTTLYVDFLLNRPKIIIEVQGDQHIEFSKFMHKTKKGFEKSQIRDKQKSKWIELNGFKLIELHYREKDEWRKKLSGN